jgi:hypothetical protein
MGALSPWRYVAVTGRFLSHVLHEAASLEPKQLIVSVLTVSFNVLAGKAEIRPHNR